MVQKAESATLVLNTAKWAWNTLIHQAIAVVSVYTVWFFCNNISVSSWHVILCSLAYIPLMAEGIILFGGDNAWTHELNRKRRYYVHGVLLLIAAGFVVTGVSLETNNKIKNNWTHFASVHAIAGLSSTILVILSLLSGYAAFNGQTLGRVARPVWFKFLHNLFGVAAYVVGVVSLLYGYKTGRFTRFTSEESRLVATVVVIILTIWSLRAPAASLYNQVKTILKG